MMLLESESKLLLASAGIGVPRGIIWRKGAPSSTVQVSEYPVAVKAQVHSGGRGKLGGVRRADNQLALVEIGSQLFSTSFNEETPEALLIEPWLPIERETYLAVTVDGRADGYAIMYSPHGGIDIEECAPPLRHAVGAPCHFRAYRLREDLLAFEPDYRLREHVVGLAQRLLRLAVAHDCTTIEINPLVRLNDGTMVAADAKVVLDEWASFRSMRIREERHAEVQRADPYLRDCLNMGHIYVRLDGDIGIISGGAGMTMAAMDMVAEHGGRPACFLDCAPGPASARGYRPAFTMLDADPAVKVILVSIFGGGTQMQRVAASLMDVMASRQNSKPVVFRLDGTNADQVPEIFGRYGVHNHSWLEDAVSEAVRIAGAGS